MDGTITNPEPSQTAISKSKINNIQIIPRGRSELKWQSWRKSPVGQAVSAIVVILIIGGSLAFFIDKKSFQNINSEPLESTNVDPPIDILAPVSSVVSGVNILDSIVQVVVAMDGEDCWSGSGTIYLDAQHVLTSYHVVQGDDVCSVDEIFVETVERIDIAPSRTHTAKVVAYDEIADLAILEIIPIDNFTKILVPVAVASAANIGDPITVIGFPAIGGSSVTVTTGEISGFLIYQGVQWIKTSISISAGNSGGGVFNPAGGLVGVPISLGSMGVDKSTDCRPDRDTNGDGQIDEDDECVSMGGFINSLSPAKRAELLANDKGLTPSS